jgi:hypothetical protein
MGGVIPKNAFLRGILIFRGRVAGGGGDSNITLCRGIQKFLSDVLLPTSKIICFVL